MRAYFLAVGLLAMLAGCSPDRDASQSRIERASAQAGIAGPAPHIAELNRPPAEVAALPDRGELWAFDTARKPVRRGAYTWHPVQLSEQHALRAVVGGDLVVTAPDGQPIRLHYERHVEHPDGNWTWIGRVPGAMPGTEAMLTFGAKAVFGSIPYGDREPLRVTTSGGRAWLMETDSSAIAALGKAGTGAGKADYLLPPKSLGAAGIGTNLQTAMLAPSAATTSAVTTVDLLLGYTSGFASRLGGQSQAVTRLTFLVDRTNQAYANSQISAQVRLVHTMQVSYSDATANNAALYDLTGVSCTELPGGSLDCQFVGSPASLQPLLTAREQYGADLVSLVRVFNDPENAGCGIGWLIGGGQVNIDATDEYAGMSVVSDSNGTGPGAFADNGMVCRDETLAHELGHNMGSAHDRDTADGDDNVLQANEYGRYPYSFGYKTSTFYTVMAYGTPGLTPFLVFSNPNITICGGAPCGVAGAADNALSMNQTVPIIATFRATAGAPTRVQKDINGDGKADLLWHNPSTSRFAYWLMNGSAITVQSPSTALSVGFAPVAGGDFNGDGYWDVVWSNNQTMSMRIGAANGAASWAALGTHPAGWKLIGAGDLNKDGRADLLWHNADTSRYAFWLMNGSTVVYAAPSIVVGAGYTHRAGGDFNADGYWDTVWSNGQTLWMRVGAANGAGSWVSLGSHPAGWSLVGAGDLNKDGRADFLWHSASSSRYAYWLMNGSTVAYAAPSITVGTGYTYRSGGDFNGDGYWDSLWSNGQTLWMRVGATNGTGGWALVASHPQGWNAIGP